MTMNRRRWLARAAAYASAGTALEFRLTGQSPAAPQLPARSDFPIAETATFLKRSALFRRTYSESPLVPRGFPTRRRGTR
jgi:hypothetical protein